MMAPATPVKFLLVDDREENLLALEGILRRDGLQLIKAHSAQEALELLLKHDIALALVDVQMPGMDGFELAELMRGTERTRRVPIIFLTAGSADKQRRFRGYEAGAVDFLTKPIETDVLRSKADVFYELWLERQEVARQRDELRAAQDENARLLAESQRIAQVLQEADRRKDEFLATLAHELRNPLAPLGNALQLMKMAGNDPAAVFKSREIMERQLMHMVRLVDDLLDISRVTTGKVRLRTEMIDLKVPVEAAIEASKPTIDAGEHSLQVNLPSESIFLVADTVRISQIIVNLLTNAAKYTPKGGRIELLVEPNSETVNIRVTDNGIGIPRDMLPNIFDLFTQVGESISRSQGGLGIGLALVKKLVELHGGTVTAESEGPGSGSTFVVRLPLVAANAAEVGAPASKASVPGAFGTKSHRILVVDDNADSAASLAMLLSCDGHTTAVAHSGPDAVTEAQKFKPEVVFLDLGLPGMSGYEVAANILKDGTRPRPVLVALTGWGSDEHRRKSKEAGFDFHLTKPIDDAHLTKVLAEIDSRAKQS